MTIAFIFYPKRKINNYCGCPHILAVSTVNYDGLQSHFLQFNIFSRELTLQTKRGFPLRISLVNVNKSSKKSPTENFIFLWSMYIACSTAMQKKTLQLAQREKGPYSELFWS